MIGKRFTILISDAPGVDNTIQRYLADKHYENVWVFHTGDRCRNNLDQRKIKAIDATSSQKGSEFYALKDVEMAREADYGLMVWDGRNRGTRNNVHNLLKCGKPVVVFLSTNQFFYTLRNVEDFSTLPV
jgi:hypothetical protein